MRVGSQSGSGTADYDCAGEQRDVYEETGIFIEGYQEYENSIYQLYDRCDP